MGYARTTSAHAAGLVAAAAETGNAATRDPGAMPVAAARTQRMVAIIRRASLKALSAAREEATARLANTATGYLAA
ncbi:hypothetical protein FRC07_011367 [Ceratobasidium sp. 392]|nr:hypothetical protein FRC07_011367 [Ceratobasidium sp. 392]